MITTYTGRQSENGNGREYRVIKLRIFRYELSIIITKYIGNGDDGNRQL